MHGLTEHSAWQCLLPVSTYNYRLSLLFPVSSSNHFASNPVTEYFSFRNPTNQVNMCMAAKTYECGFVEHKVSPGLQHLSSLANAGSNPLQKHLCGLS